MLVIALAGCATAPPSADPTGVSAPPTTSAPSPSGAEPTGLTGSWRGEIADAANRYPVTIRLAPCEIGERCGESEYDDPAANGSVLCAADLQRVAGEAGALSLKEVLTYHAQQCLPSVLTIREVADGAITVEAAPELGAPPFALGTLAVGEPPAGGGIRTGPIAGLGTPTATTSLGGAATQYGAAGFGSLWLPLEDTGEVVRIDADDGAITARIPVGDPGAVERGSDPHGVAVDDEGVWVTSAADSTLAFIDPGTNAVTRRIDVGARPYAIAIDGNRAWVTSFEDGLLLDVDLATGAVRGTVAVESPTGVAVGDDAVWVVRHRDNSVVRIDPATRTVVADVSVARERPNPVCGLCVENLVVAGGDVWTADNHGRTVTRIDETKPASAATVELPLRAWDVAQGEGHVWASQFEADDGDRVVGPDGWQLAEIDPATGKATLHDLPSQAVFVTDGAVWVTVPGRRGDMLTRVALDR